MEINMQRNVSNSATTLLDEIQIPIDESLYAELKKRGLLIEPTWPVSWGIHLVKDGEIGLCLNNGKPEFLAPGRHTLWSPFREYIGTVSITQKNIRLGPIEIITINQGELGLTVKNGENIILDQPGRYILRTPHQYLKSAQANERYIELGTHRRITVPKGYVALAFDNGKQFIISPDDTKEGPYITNSPTFSFDPKRGFQSTMKREIKLETLAVNTKENMPANVAGVIRYHIADPNKSFFGIEDVHSAIKLQAEATLTSVFMQLSIDQIGSSLSSTNVTSFKGKGKNNMEDMIPDDLIHKATDLFIDEFKNVVEKWGVELDNLNIFSMEFTDSSFRDTLRTRTQRRMEAATNLANVEAINEVAIKESERKRQQQIIDAEGQAQAIKKIADARKYAAEQDTEAAKMLSSQPLAADLARLKAQAEIVEKMGNNTVFMPHDLRLGDYGVRGTQGQMFWLRPTNANTNSSVQRLQLEDKGENKHSLKRRNSGGL